MRSSSRKPSLGYEITSLKWNTNEPSTFGTFYMLSDYQHSNLENCNVSLPWAVAPLPTRELELVYELALWMISSRDLLGFPGVLYVPAIWDVHDSLQQISKDCSDATGSSMGYRHTLPESNFTQ